MGDRSLHGAAIVFTRDARSCGLEVVAGEPPPRHASITGWEWSAADPLMQKARQKEQAALLAGKAVVIRAEQPEPH